MPKEDAFSKCKRKAITCVKQKKRQLISAAKHRKHQHGRYCRVPGQAVAGHVAKWCRTANNSGYLGLAVVAVHFVGEKRAHGRVYGKQDKCLPLQAIAEEYTLRQHVF